MIEHYNKEDFMCQPIEIMVTREACGTMSFPQEQTLLFHICGKDYDIRDLIWRIIRADGEIFELQNKIKALEEKVRELGVQSARVQL